MELKDDHLLIQNETEKRGITSLIHFTPTINLIGIIEQQALLSRANLEKLDIEVYDLLDYVQFTDQVRYDDKNYINLSITRPNIYLMKAFIQRTLNDPSIEWCVLTLNTDILLWKETLYSVTNAASTVAKQNGICGNFEAFKKLFAERIMLKQQHIRASNLPSNQTTDAQAEVLVKDKIPLSFIKSVAFRNQESMASTKAALSWLDCSSLVFEVNPSYFS